MQKLNTSQTDFRAYEANFYIKRSKGFSKNLFIIIELLYSAFVILTTTVRKRRTGRLRQLNGWLRVRRPLYKFLQSPSYVQIIWRRLRYQPAAGGPPGGRRARRPAGARKAGGQNGMPAGRPGRGAGRATRRVRWADMSRACAASPRSPAPPGRTRSKASDLS